MNGELDTFLHRHYRIESGKIVKEAQLRKHACEVKQLELEIVFLDEREITNTQTMQATLYRQIFSDSLFYALRPYSCA